MDAEPLRLALVGAGRMGRTHLASLAAAPSVSVEAVVEPHEATRAELRRAGLRLHATLDELLAAGGVDAALVAAPSDRHLEIVRRLVSAELPVLCEKPCGIASTETAEAATLAEAAGVVLQVGYWRRFVPALRSLRERIAGGAFGELELVACWQWDASPPSPAFSEQSGGILVDMGVHEFDQLRWLTGRELETFAAVASPEAAGDPDVVQVAGRLTGGALASVSLGRRFAEGDCCWVDVIGSERYERCAFVWGEEGDRLFRRAIAAQAEAFAGAVRGAVPAGASGADAVAAVDAAERAARRLQAAE